MEINLLQLFSILNESLKIRIYDSNGTELGFYDGKNSIDCKYNQNIVIYANPDWDKRELYVELNIDW